MKHRVPPISVASCLARGVARDLRSIVGGLLENAPVGARETLDGLLVTSAEDIDSSARKLLNGEPEGADVIPPALRRRGVPVSAVFTVARKQTTDERRRRACR